MDDLPTRPWKDLSPDAQQLYLAEYRRTWEKCTASGLEDREELAVRAHRAAVLAVEGEFEIDDRGRIVRAPVGEEIDRAKLDANVAPEE